MWETCYFGFHEKVLLFGVKKKIKGIEKSMQGINMKKKKEIRTRDKKAMLKKYRKGDFQTTSQC